MERAIVLTYRIKWYVQDEELELVDLWVTQCSGSKREHAEEKKIKRKIKNMKKGLKEENVKLKLNN